MTDAPKPVAWMRTERQTHKDFPPRIEMTRDAELVNLWRHNEYTESLVPLYSAELIEQCAQVAEELERIHRLDSKKPGGRAWHSYRAAAFKETAAAIRALAEVK